jgi:hypothetical protein
MKIVRVAVTVALFAGSVGGCETAPPDAMPADSTALSADSAPPVADTGWVAPGNESIAVRRSRAVDLTGDGRADRVEVTAHGARYDSLDVVLTIHGADGDTLWREEWPSLLYFQYDDVNEHTPESLARVVQSHVDTLLHDSRFGMSGGLPARLRMSTTPMVDIMREAAQYHLAELDWRRQAGLRPAQPTPPAAHSVINASTVTRERVERVLDELSARPSFMYFAGGEATYAIAWSGIENAFVRIYACC